MVLIPPVCVTEKGLGRSQAQHAVKSLPTKETRRGYTRLIGVCFGAQCSAGPRRVLEVRWRLARVHTVPGRHNQAWDPSSRGPHPPPHTHPSTHPCIHPPTPHLRSGSDHLPGTSHCACAQSSGPTSLRLRKEPRTHLPSQRLRTTNSPMSQTSHPGPS